MSAAKAWDDNIWTAIYDRVRETRIEANRSLPAAEQLYRLGWILAVFGIPDKAIEWAMLDEKIVTLWLTPNGKLEARENALLIDEEIPVLPIEIDPFIKQLISELWNLPFESEIKFEWQGPASLFPPLRFGIFSDSSSFSLPAETLLRLLEQWKNYYLFEKRLQFLEPPVGRQTLITQAVCVLHPRPGGDASNSSEPSKRRNYLKRPEISKALEEALENPDQLELEQLKWVYGAIECSAIIPFSPPFSKRSSIYSGRFNLLHAFGKTVLRCLVACCLAERDERLPKAALKTINDLRQGYELFHKLKPQDVFFYERLGIFLLTDASEFVTRLFGIVKDYNLIDDFVPPSFPDASDAVPEIQGTNKSTASGQKIEIVGLSTFEGAFGKLITEWPLPDRETQPKESEADLG